MNYVHNSILMEEERRVFYVAVTRAKDQLYLISPAIISGFGRNQIAKPSQFIKEIEKKHYKKSVVNFNPSEEKPIRKEKQGNQELKEFKSALDLFLEKEKEKKSN